VGEARRGPHSVPPPRRKRGQHLRCDGPNLGLFLLFQVGVALTHPLTASRDAGYYAACSFSALKRDARLSKSKHGNGNRKNFGSQGKIAVQRFRYSVVRICHRKLDFQVCSRKCYLLSVQVIEGGEYCDTFSHGQSFCLLPPDFCGQ
jgi:hypothetical protein